MFSQVFVSLLVCLRPGPSNMIEPNHNTDTDRRKRYQSELVDRPKEGRTRLRKPWREFKKKKRIVLYT